MEDLILELEKHGIVTIDIPIDTVSQIHKQFQHEWQDVSGQLNNFNWKIAQVNISAPTTFLDTAIYHNKKFATYKEYTVIDMGSGRYDFSPLAIPITLIPPQITQIISHFLERNWSAYFGGLPVVPSNASGDGYWHRDFISLFEREYIDLALPPVYFTAIIPLDDIPVGSGSTEFVPGSHKVNFQQAGITNNEQLQHWIATRETLHTDLKVGKAYIFNGLTLHRGTKNSSDKCRNAMYIVFKKNWYSDDDPKNYTFI